MCTHQRGYKKMFRIWGYSESRATFTLIFNCPNSTFWRALTTGQSSLLIPAPSHELKRNIIYMETNRQRYISCGELKAKTSALMGKQVLFSHSSVWFWTTQMWIIIYWKSANVLGWWWMAEVDSNFSYHTTLSLVAPSIFLSFKDSCCMVESLNVPT